MPLDAEGASTIRDRMVQAELALFQHARAYTPPEQGTLPTVDLNIPDTFETSAHYDPDAAMQALVRLGKKGGERWPDLVDVPPGPSGPLR